MGLKIPHGIGKEILVVMCVRMYLEVCSDEAFVFEILKVVLHQ